MLGRPTPTKQTRVPASSRAAATIIISDALQPGTTVVICTRRSRPIPTVPERDEET